MADFATDTEPYRRELLAHCYRILGSVDDAEDVVQETYLRAWRSFESFEGRSSVRNWLYRIATNACLSALSHRSRRFLPSGLGGPADDPLTPLAAAEAPWLQPVPDSMLDPAAIVTARDSLRIALIAALQKLPGRQRAVFILRDVLAWLAVGRRAGDGHQHGSRQEHTAACSCATGTCAPDVERAVEPGDLSAVLAQYIAAVEEADGAALEQLLRVDARVEATPWRTWFSGRATCVPYLVQQVLGSPGDWRLLPTSANGQPAAVGYHRGRPYGILVLTVTSTGIATINAFGDPALVKRFGFPAHV